jgi:long-chain fatty acid transport protein
MVKSANVGKMPVGCAAFVAAWLAVGGGAAHGGGFYVPEIGGRAVSMGGAMTAQASDASTIFHNPAGMTGLAPGTELELGGALFFPRVSHFRHPVQDPATGAELRFQEVRNTNSMGAAPYLGAVFDPGVDGLRAGVAVYVPFGAAINYPTDSAARHVVTGIDLRTIFVSPAVAYQIGRWVSVGVSANVVYSDFSLANRNALSFVTGDPEANPDPDPALEGQTTIEGRDPFTLGATAGLQVRDPQGRYAMGLSVMTPVTLELRGTANVRNEAIAELRDEAGTLVQAAGARADDVRVFMPLPLVARLGMAVRPVASLTLALDFNYQRWSAWDRLVIDFARQHELLPTPGARMDDVVVDNRWRDTFSVRAGASLRPIADTPFELRAGVFFDQSPIDDRRFDLLTPDSDKVGLAGGVGYALPFAAAGGRHRLELAAGFLHLFLRERDVRPGPLVDGRPTAGSDRTILNKPAPSFHHGVTRTRFEILYLSATARF